MILISSLTSRFDNSTYDNLGSEISDVVPEMHAITGYKTTSYKFYVENVHFFRIVCKGPSSLILIKMLGLNTALIEKLSKRQKIFVQTIIYKGNLNENYLSIRVRQS